VILPCQNLLWAWRDGVILGVYEPISMMIKAAISSGLGLLPSSFLKVGLLIHSLNAALLYRLVRGYLHLVLPGLSSSLVRGKFSTTQASCI
jgi:hypothetical protein